MYYNTNKIKGAELNLAEIKTEKQEEIIKKIFIASKTELTASDVMGVFPDHAPLTSIRRAITNLKNENFLEKTELKKPGIYGSPEHFYKIKSQQLDLF